jgi:hypothetical protein
MLSRREKSIKASIDLMFKGLDHDELKEIILATALEKSEEEKEELVENIKKKQKQDLEYINEKFEIIIDKDNPYQTQPLEIQEEEEEEPGNKPSEK